MDGASAFGATSSNNYGGTISKYYDGQIINTLRLNKKTMKKENINKPYLIEQYNRFMKGVDLMDQYLCLYMNKL